MSDQAIKYAEIVDTAALQALMDSLNQVIGIANAIIDTDGIVITQSGWQDSCVRFHRIHPQSHANCITSDTSLSKSMLKGEAFTIYQCLNGLVDAAMPIFVNNQHVANIFTGQCFLEPPDTEKFRLQARQLGYDEADYLEAIAKVPVIPRERLESITHMYAQLAQTMASNGLDRLHQQQATAELARLNQELSQRVNERTVELSEKNQQLIEEKQALEDSQARLSALFENMSSGVAVYRPCDDGSDFIFTAFNKAAEQIEKISRRQLIGKKLSEAFPGITEFGLPEVLGRVAQTGKPEYFRSSLYRDQRITGWRENYVYKLPSGEVVAIYDDVTERKQAESVLQLTQFSINHSADCLYWINADGNIKYVNESSCRILGYSREELLRLSVPDIDTLTTADTWSQHWQGLKDKGAIKLESVHISKQGQRIPVEIAANYLVFEGQEYNCAFVRDITERKAFQAELERQAHVDYLTGIANRRYFLEQAEMTVARAVRYGGALSVFMLDIDNFKKVNDTLGHAAGDRVLEKIGGVFAQILRETDIPGRMGGEEFAVLLPETGLETAVEVAERLREFIADQPIRLKSGLPLQITVSIGIAAFNPQDMNIDGLLNLADQALYKAKAAGRNRVLFQP